MARGVVWALLPVSLASGASPCRADSGAPRDLTAAERQAVRLVVELFDEGPAAWAAQLSSTSPLRRYTGSAAADAIALRTGPLQRATWRLQTPATSHGPDVAIFTVEQPSGMEDHVVLELVEEDGGWRIRSVRSLIDPAPAPVPPREAGPREAGLPWGGLAALVCALGLALAVAPRGQPRLRLAATAGALAGVLLVAATAVGCRRGREAAAARAAPAVVADPRVALLPLRRALASSADAHVETLLAALERDRAVADVVRLWKAELRLRQLRLGEARALLGAGSTDLPLAQVLEARAAFVAGDEQAAFPAYSYAADHGIDHDGLRLEIAEAHLLLGYPYEADAALRRLAETGSRLPEVYYRLAEIAAYEELADDGIAFFQTAWSARPLTRERVLASPGLARLATREEIFRLLEVASSQEPALRTLPERRGAPLRFPGAARLTVNGAQLTVRLGDDVLEVPGGGYLAPEAPLEDAGAAERREEQEVLAVAADWLRTGAARALGQPVARRQLERLAQALARRGRWADLVHVTRGLEQWIEQTPSQLVGLRAAALVRLHRGDDALALLVAHARSERAGRRRDPGTLLAMADVLVGRGEYDLALRLVQRASSLTGWQDEARVHQVEMEKELAAAGRSLREGSFELRYGEASDPIYVDALADVLELERRRLGAWIPGATFAGDPLGVDLFPLRDFLANYSGNVPVVALFDGRIRLPLADVPRLDPPVVRIVSHELAHAMITAATRDAAPKWLHEGLAQHVEQVAAKANPMPRLLAADRVMSLAVVEAALSGFSERQLVGQAYEQAEWAVFFIEQRFGRPGIHRLLAAYRANATTEEALATALGLTVASFDDAFRQWSAAGVPATVHGEVQRYELHLADELERAESQRLPRVSGGDVVAHLARRQGPHDAAAVRAWHRQYEVAVAPLRGTLLRLVRRMSEAPLDEIARDDCARLAKRLPDAEASAVLAAPIPGLERHLRSAFGWFSAMAATCQRGDAPAAIRMAAQAELSLGYAGAVLDPYGLEP